MCVVVLEQHKVPMSEAGTFLLVGGFPSGGTDLTKTVLNAHRSISLAGEAPLLHVVAQRGFTSGDAVLHTDDSARFLSLMRDLDVYENFESVPDPDQDASVEELTRRLLGGTGVPVWGNKTPQNSERLSELGAIYPRCKFLTVIRDPRDTALSWQSKWGKDPLWAADKWATRMSEVVRQGAHLGDDRFRTIRFEALLVEPEETLRGVCDWLGIPFDSQMLRHEEVTDSLDGKRNYGQPLVENNFDKWRRSDPVLIQRIEEICFDSMSLHDYEHSLATTKRPLKRWEKRRAVVSDAVALLAVGNRSRADNSIRQRLSDVMSYAQRLRLR